VFGLERLKYKLSCITLPALAVYIVRIYPKRVTLYLAVRTRFTEQYNNIHNDWACVYAHLYAVRIANEPSPLDGENAKRKSQPGPAFAVYIRISTALTVGGHWSHRRVCLTRYCSLRIRYIIIVYYTNRTRERKTKKRSEINAVYCVQCSDIHCTPWHYNNTIFSVYRDIWSIYFALGRCMVTRREAF